MTTHSRLVWISRAAATAGGLGILFIAVMVTADVLLRKFFSVTLGGATEIAGFVFAVATALSYPFVLLDRANIRIDVIYTRLPNWMKAFLDLAALLLVLYFVGWLTSSVFALFNKSWSAGSTSVGTIIIPLWVPQLFWMLGFALLTLTALYLTVHTLGALLRRDWGAINRIAGVPSLVEIIEEETHIEIEPAAFGTANQTSGEPR
jgi:TRAP-type mannitol/chloroaromatic compound transport system permease small subunit